MFFLLDLKRLYFLTGVENKPTVFLFNDTQALEESFLEDISNILSSGEVPNLYKPEEFEEVCENDFHLLERVWLQPCCVRQETVLHIVSLHPAVQIAASELF